MNHFFIGESPNTLFVSRMPARQQPSKRAVLLCYPFGQEYMRAHKAYRQLASLLARQGMDVYRFDYPGTGDSYGDGSEQSLSLCAESAKAVLQHLSKQYDYTSIDLVGLRFGALICAAIANNDYGFGSKTSLHNIVLWDPFVLGQSFIDDMAKQMGDADLTLPVWNVHGYDLPAALREQLADFDACPLLRSSQSKTACKLHLQLSHENDQSRHFEQTLAAESYTKTIVGPANDWNFVDTYGSILMPSTLVKSIVDTLTKVTA